MGNGIIFSEVWSYVVYFGSLFSATFFAYLSEKYYKVDKKGLLHANRCFLVMSFLSLFIPLAFRGYGVDYENYIAIYNNIKGQDKSFITNYNGMPEPLYALLNYLVLKLFSNVQWVFIISSFVSLLLIYIFLSRHVKKISFPMFIWSFGFSYYFFMYGLVRISIAVGIVTYSYKYIEMKKFRKFLCCTLIATLFHYSAIIMIPVFFLVNYNIKIFYKKHINLFRFWIVLIFASPILYYLIITLFPILFGQYNWFSRYNSYFYAEKNIRVFNNIGCILPLVLIIIIYKNNFLRNINYSFVYIKMIMVMIAFIIMSIFFPIHRITYYLFPAACYLYASVRNLNYKNSNKRKVLILYNMFMFFIGIIWIILSIFRNTLWYPFLIPYYYNLPIY